jgi:hypothetical protein
MLAKNYKNQYGNFEYDLLKCCSQTLCELRRVTTEHDLCLLCSRFSISASKIHLAVTPSLNSDDPCTSTEKLAPGGRGCAKDPVRDSAAGNKKVPLALIDAVSAGREGRLKLFWSVF